MTDLPKTEQELEDIINARVKEREDELTSKHNGEMASMRKKHEQDLAKAKEQAGLTAEQIAQEKIKEQNEAERAELENLRAYKKSNEISAKLAKEGLPSYFKNDTRLLNADEGTIDKVIKDVKKDYEETQQKGSPHSTVVQTANTANKQTDNKAEVYSATGEAIKKALGM